MDRTSVIFTSNGSDFLEDEPLDLLSENPVVGVIIAVLLSVLCLLTVFGNAVVLHAIRTERRLQTVSLFHCFLIKLLICVKYSTSFQGITCDFFKHNFEISTIGV